MLHLFIELNSQLNKFKWLQNNAFRFYTDIKTEVSMIISYLCQIYVMWDALLEYFTFKAIRTIILVSKVWNRWKLFEISTTYDLMKLITIMNIYTYCIKEKSFHIDTNMAPCKIKTNE